MEREQLLEKTKKALRSVLISAPRGVPAHLLLSDYRKVMGKELPFRALGFSSVEQFVAALDDVVRVAPGPTGVTTLYPVANQETKQIMRFVAAQKKAPLKKSLVPPPTVHKTPAKMAGFTRKTQRFGVRQRPVTMGPRRGWTHQAPPVWTHQAPPVWTHQAPPVWTHQSPAGRPSLNLPPRLQQLPPPVRPLSPSGRLGPYFAEPNYTKRIVSTKPAGMESSHDRTVVIKPAGLESRCDSTITVKTYGMEQSRDSAAKAVRVPWFSALNQHTPLSIEKLNSMTASSQLPKMASVEGYYAGSRREVPDTGVQGGIMCKLLLLTNDGSGRGKFPAVMLLFRRPYWDVMEYPGPQQLEKGTQLRVFGIPRVLFNKKKNKSEPLIEVAYYETPSSSPVGGRGSSAAPATPPSTPQAGGLEDIVFKLLKDKPNGVLASRLAKEIMSVFNVEAPKDLPEIAKQFSFVECEKITDELSVLHLKQQQKLPPLPSTAVFDGAQDIFDVVVCYISSPTSFYVRLIGPQHSEEFSKLETAMTSSLSKQAPPPTLPVCEEGLYAFHWSGEGDSMWCRALALSVTDDQAEVVFPDYGNTASVRVEQLRTLPPAFHQLSFQAIHCCLHGLTDASVQAFDKLCELALDKTCIAQVMDRSGTRASVELMDGEGGELINSLLVRELHPLSSMHPPLPRPGEPMVPAILCDVDEDGITTLQLQGAGHTMLQQLMKLINDSCSKKTTASSLVRKATEGLVCCSRYSHDGEWYRVRIKAVQDKKVVVEYMDYGNEDEVELLKLRKAPESELMELPPQAVKCCLHSLPPPRGQWTEEAIAKCSELIACEVVYVEVVEEGAVPVVRLFVEEEKGGERLDVNQRLLLQTELFLSSGRLVRNLLNFEQLTLHSLVQVLVSHVEAPDCFTVQLASKLDELSEMMSDKLPAAVEGQPRPLEPGVCAARSSLDQRWYRVFTTALPSDPSTTVTVEFLDYGGTEEVSVLALRVLPEALLSLPFQAIAAALHGVAPLGGWSKEKKTLFTTAVFEKQLFAVLKCVGEAGESQVSLLDTSNKEKTVVLAELLLQEKELAK